MKGLTGVVILLALGTAATAKPAPVERALPALALNATDINVGPLAAPLERQYFQAPQQQLNAGGFLCRMPLVVFDKTRLASSCR